MEQVTSTEDILGYNIHVVTCKEAVERVSGWALSGTINKVCACANPHSLVVAETDETFFRALKDADLLIPDGTGIVLASKVLGGRISERVTGSDIFQGLSEKLNQTGGASYFFMGSTDSTLKTIQDKMEREYPNIEYAGGYSPPYKESFNDEDNGLMLEAVNKVKPDVLWVGMTAPKQEKWIYENRNSINARFICAIGAVFDFYSGKVTRSHPVFQKMGLEWLPRFLRQPRRLFKRNFVSSPVFLYSVLKQYMK